MPTPGSGSLRGTVLLPHADTVEVRRDAVVHWRDGRVVAVTEPRGDEPDAGLLLPGFVDLHCHWPQAHVRGQFSGQLLPWLRESIWPAEALFADVESARERARTFLREAIASGTCAGLLFGPPFLAASLAFLDLAPHGFFDGPALMEANGPDVLLRPVIQTLAGLHLAPEAVRQRLVVSPRFAPSLTHEGLLLCGRAVEDLGLPVQSHVSENEEEIAWVRDLFPDALDYVDVYDRAGLLGPRTILAHAVHLSDRELARLAQTGTVVAHCPTSNDALQSGRMPLERLRSHGVAWVLATDVGAGPRLSLLDVMRAFLQTHQGHTQVTAAEALIAATRRPGAFLAALDGELTGLGTLEPGAPAHLVALPRPDGADDAEGLLRAVLEHPPQAFETLPTRVVLWGT